MFTTFNDDETAPQRASRERAAQENAARHKELLEREQNRRAREQAERAAAHQTYIQSEGRLAWQALKVARIDKEKAERELRVATESFANAQRKYDELVAQGYVDDISPVLEKQEREKVQRETTERERREKVQADAIGNSNKSMSLEERERFNAAIRERNANPTERLCPGCKTHVLLINGKLPEEHTYRFRNEFGEVEKKVCHPFE